MTEHKFRLMHPVETVLSPLFLSLCTGKLLLKSMFDGDRVDTCQEFSLALEYWILFRAIPACRCFILPCSYAPLQYYEICGNLTVLNDAPGYS